MKDRIVVATDFSQSSLASLAKAIYLAKRNKCTLDVIHVVEYSVFHDPKKDKKAGFWSNLVIKKKESLHSGATLLFASFVL